MNLRKQVEPLGNSRASGFLAQRHAHHAASRLTLMKRWLKRAFRHHVQSRELKLWMNLSAQPGPSARPLLRDADSVSGAAGAGSSGHQHAIEQFLELVRAFGDFTAARAAGVAAS